MGTAGGVALRGQVVVVGVTAIVLVLSGCGAMTHSSQTSTPSTAAAIASSPTVPTANSATATTATADGEHRCGNGVTAGAHTSCPFALNVTNAYASTPKASASPGTTTISAYSPVTHLTYTMRCVLTGSTVRCTGGTASLVTWTACAGSDPEGCLHPQPVTGRPTGHEKGAPCGGDNRWWNGKCLPDECTTNCQGSGTPATASSTTCGPNGIETQQGCQQVAPNCPAGTSSDTQMCMPDSYASYADCLASAKWQANQPEIGIHVIWQNNRCQSYISTIARWW